MFQGIEQINLGAFHLVLQINKLSTKQFNHLQKAITMEQLPGVFFFSGLGRGPRYTVTCGILIFDQNVQIRADVPGLCPLQLECCFQKYVQVRLFPRILGKFCI